MLDCSSASSRLLLNFAARTTMTAFAESMSTRRRSMASPTRMPVAASSPIIVWNVADRRGVGMSRGTVSIRARTSASE